uniref:Uncharacterized conserved protein, DUF497 family n=1 Tax=Candidatus Kentrum sp. MB TaxID=2138164 RepID=A0A450XG16_9GAMM|nr:MAG: Uncharacterized conserved protein, DUF497 family [Candidatus Kentron sp. MB]VFK32561.1 MAG: Uncharacterized conserved protein, DUF497 family [Candidatus Kentron sp. MB]VFK75979.1 MAG: Uncharacterized conserved protein, DUF497 family [Candidatus Kentron sp. MB]
MELSEGTPIYCAPAGPSHSRHNVTGAAILDSDPDVEWSATDAGFELKKNTMRAPDVSVAPPPTDKSEGGWILGAPPLAVEYADTGQNEADLKKWKERGLDFARCGEVFGGHHFTTEDTRWFYEEKRYITVGKPDGRMVIVVWTFRDYACRIISMRKANEREQVRYLHRLD